MVELRSSFEEWQKNDTATLKGEKDRFTAMKREKDAAIRRAEDTVAESKEDFNSLDTEAKDLDVQVEATKKGLMSVKAEVKALTDKLRAKRQEYRDKEASLSASASAASSALMQQMQTLQRASGDVSKLRALSSELQVPAGKTSLRQKTMALQNNAGLARLQKQPEKFQKQSAELKKEYQTEEQEMEKLVESKQKDIKSLMDDLERLNAEYGGKQEETALVQRDIQNNQRTLERDTKVRQAATDEWTKKESLLKGWKALRQKIIQNIGAAIGALQGSGCSAPASFAEIGVSTRPSSAVQHARVVPLWQSRPAAPEQGFGPMSFVQLNAETSDQALLQMGGSLAYGGDPFADVKEKITQMITALKQKINEDMNKQDFCDDEKARGEEELAAKREDLDVLTANIRQLKTALAKSNDDSAFAENEVGRLAAEVGRLNEARALTKSKVLTMKKEHAMAIEVLDQSIEILRKFYNLPEGGEPAKSQSGITGQALIDIMLDTKKLIGELSAMLDSGDGELEILSQSLIKDSTDAKTARETERDDLITAKAEQASDLADTEADLKALEGELKLMVDGQENLAEECGPQKVDPDARAKAREEEIQALQDGLKVLAGEDIPLSAAASLLQEAAPQNQNGHQLGTASTLMAAIQGGGGDESVVQTLQNSLRAAASSETNWQSQLAGIQ